VRVVSVALYLETMGQAATLEGMAHYTLASRGYPEKLVNAAISRARGQAIFHTRRLSPDIRGRAFLQELAAELLTAEEWLNQFKTGMAR
jgi:hypothetical protein